MTLLIAALILVIQVASGACWWAWIRRGQTLPELLGMGLALGTFASMLSAVALQSMVPGAWALPALVTCAAALIARRSLVSSLRSVQLPRPQGIALLIGLGAGLAVVAGNWLRTPLDAVSDKSYADIYFFEALSRGLATFGPGESILMTGGSLRYHWFTYAWIGELGQTAGLGSFVALTRILPLVAMVGLVLLAIAWTDLVPVRRGPRWVPSLAALLVVLAGYVGALYGSVLNFDSPSQSLATVWLLALGLAFVRFVLSGSLGAGIVAIAMTGAITGGKVSHAAVGIAGMVATSIVGAVARTPWWRRSAVITAASLIAAGATYLLVLSGATIDGNLIQAVAVKASTWQGLDPLIGRWGAPAGTAALLLAVLARPAGMLWLMRRRFAEPAVLFAAGGLLVGVVALIALRQGVNELWFILAASAAAAAVASVGAGQAMAWAARRGARRPLVAAGIIAIAASAASLVLSWNWQVEDSVWPPGLGLFSTAGLLHWLAVIVPWIIVAAGALLAVRRMLPAGTRRTGWLAFALTALMLASLGSRPAALWTTEREIQTETGVVQPAPALPATTTGATNVAEREAASAWLRSRADGSDVVATSDPGSAYLPAITGLRAFLAGSRYQAGLGDTRELAQVAERGEVSLQLADREAVLEPLCAAGVRWVWLEGDTGSWPLAYSGPGIGVTDLRGQCP